MNLLLYKSSESNKLFSSLFKNLESQSEVNLKVFSQLSEIVSFVKTNGNAIILIEVKTNREIKVLSTILKKIGPYFKKSYLRVACSYKHPNSKYKAKFRKGGVAFYTETFSDTGYFKSRLEGSSSKLASYNQSSSKKQSKNKIIEYVGPLNTLDDVWIVRDEKLFKVVLGKFIVKLMGPGPMVLSWEKVRPSKEFPLLKCWTWSQNTKESELFPEQGIWHFCGDKLPPQYDSTLEQWVFTGNKLVFYLKKGNQVITKFHTTKDKVVIADNSKEAQSRIDVIYQSIYGDQSFSKKAASLGGNEEGEGSTDSMKLGNLSGEGGASDNLEKNWGGDISGSEKQGGPLTGESSTDDLGAYYKGNAKKKRSYESDDGDDFGFDEDFEDVGDLDEMDMDADEGNGGLSLTNDIFNGNLKGKGKSDKLQKNMGHEFDFGQEKKSNEDSNDDLDLDFEDIGDLDQGLNADQDLDNVYDINKASSKNKENKEKQDDADQSEIDFDGVDIDEDNKGHNEEEGDDFSFEEEGPDGSLRGQAGTDKIQKYMGHKHDFGDDDLPDLPELEEGNKSKKNSKGSLGKTKDNPSPQESGFSGQKEIDASSGARGKLDSIKDQSRGGSLSGKDREKASGGRNKKSSLFDADDNDVIVIKGEEEVDENFGIDLEEGVLKALVKCPEKDGFENVECEFIDFFEENLTLRSSKNIPIEKETVNIDVSFTFHENEVHLNLVGNISYQEDDEDGDGVYVQLNVNKIPQKEIDNFLELYGQRQSNIKDYVKKTRVQ